MANVFNKQLMISENNAARLTLMLKKANNIAKKAVSLDDSL